uniref:3'-5' exonuclease domain-containing protein n=1 Tax=Heterorhabditis bacteriophora TaxID=37862 RepID=A0A1I7WW74_HETBA
MIERQMFKDAMEVVAQYQLHDCYGLEEFVIPCILQDKAPLVHKYLEDRKHLQRQYMRFLDGFVGLSEEEVKKRLKPYKDKKIMTLQYGRFSGKTIEKMICRLTSNDQSLQLDDVLPRFFRNRAEGNLRYKVQSRFTSNELSDEAYFGYVSDALKRADDKMRKYFITYLVATRNKDDAVRWVLYFNMPDTMIPPDLVSYMQNNPITVNEAAKNLKKYELYNEDTYIELFPNYPIIMVDNWISLSHLIEEIRNETVIGIDSEWKPQYLATGENIALLQVATSRAVYLIDFCILEEKLTLEQWKIFIKILLCGEATKLGFDLMNDLRALFAGPITYKLKPLEKDINNVICLKRMVENLLVIDDQFVNLTSKCIYLV